MTALAMGKSGFPSSKILLTCDRLKVCWIDTTMSLAEMIYFKITGELFFMEIFERPTVSK